MVASALGETIEQDCAQTAALPRIAHRDGDLRRSGIVSDRRVAGDGNRLSGRRVGGDERLLAVMVEHRQVPELARIETLHGHQEPVVARGRAQMLEQLLEQTRVGRLDCADLDTSAIGERLGGITAGTSGYSMTSRPQDLKTARTAKVELIAVGTGFRL